MNPGMSARLSRVNVRASIILKCVRIRLLCIQTKNTIDYIQFGENTSCTYVVSLYRDIKHRYTLNLV